MGVAQGNVRCFVAVELPADVKAALEQLEQDIQAQLVPVLGAAPQHGLHWVSPGAVHLTLKFLGATPSDKLPLLIDALGRAIGGRSTGALTLDGLGMFPSQRRPRVVWVGLTGDIDSLVNLQRDVELALVPLGFPPEQRPFSPHLTLARVREELGSVERQALANVIVGVQSPPGLTIPVHEVSLMRSELRREGARYSRLAVMPLV